MTPFAPTVGCGGEPSQPMTTPVGYGLNKGYMTPATGHRPVRRADRWTGRHPTRDGAQAGETDGMHGQGPLRSSNVHGVLPALHPAWPRDPVLARPHARHRHRPQRPDSSDRVPRPSHRPLHTADHCRPRPCTRTRCSGQQFTLSSAETGLSRGRADRSDTVQEPAAPTPDDQTVRHQSAVDPPEYWSPASKLGNLAISAWRTSSASY
jgi:hypothetical protein